MTQKNQPFTFIDLFAGIGGFRIALESFGGKCVFSSDWDKISQLVYEVNFGEKPIGDIVKIKEKDIPEHTILCAGFPCQAFSISGKRLGFDDTRGTLFFDVARIAKYHKPSVLFLENVKNFEKHDNGRTLEVVYKTLRDIGYDVFHKVLNASHYGVPQSRKRIFIIGFRKDLGVENFNFPIPSYQAVKLKDVLEPASKTKDYVIKRDDIKLKSEKEKNINSDLFGTNVLHPVRVGTINNGGQGERIYSIEGHAITLSAYGGGAASKTGAYLVDGVVRKLTPRECARLMGFPDSYKIPVTNNQAYKLFGNSVVIPVLKSIFNEIYKKIK